MTARPQPPPAVLVTRAADDAAPWVDALARRGHEVLTLPCLAIEPIDDPATRTALRDGLATSAWIALTSPHGVDAVARLAGAPLPAALRVAAVGPATARACRDAFSRCDLEASDGTGASLARELAALMARDPRPPRRVLAPGADRARLSLEEALAPLAVEVLRLAVYRTVPAPAAEPKQDLAARRIGAILLASPSAVEGLFNTARVPEDALVVTIGPTTSEAARAHGLAVAAEADRPDLDAMIAALERALGALPRAARKGEER